MTKKQLKVLLSAKAKDLNLRVNLASLQPAIRTFFQQRPVIWGVYIVDKASPVQLALCVNEVTQQYTIVKCNYILSYGLNTIVRDV